MENTNAKNDLEAKVAEEKEEQMRFRKRFIGFSLWMLSYFSTIAMIPVTIDVYEHQKKHLLEHPEKINHYAGTAERDARTGGPLMLGLLWGAANILAAGAGGSLFLGDYKNGKK